MTPSKAKSKLWQAPERVFAIRLVASTLPMAMSPWRVVTPMLLSSAARILELAETTLPILDLGDAEDPSPLMKAAENSDVPWEMLATAQADPALAWAGFYLFLTLAPLAGATLNARRERSRRGRQ